jgi:hypothetical protein
LLVTGGRKDNNYYVSGNLAYKEDITREPQQLKHRVNNVLFYNYEVYPGSIYKS